MSINASRDQNRIPTLLGVSSGDGTTPVKIYADPITHRLYVDSIGGGGGTTILNVTGTVNGSNQIFTVLSTPSLVFVDGIGMQAVDNNGFTQWTYVGTTLTLFTPPPINAIFALG